METYKEFIEYIAENFFDGDKGKSKRWLFTENPLLGNVSPMHMIYAGRSKKLEKFLWSIQTGNIP